MQNPTYWKRVAESKCNNKAFLEECRRNDDFDWKNLGVESKLTEIYENTTKELWDDEKMAKIGKAVSCHDINN